MMAMSRFVETVPQALSDNVFTQIGKEWMLITAGDERQFNTMTASWGGLGVMWNQNVSFIFVRPGRYTYEFLEKGDAYSLSFLGDEPRRALQICGTKSGRDTDKVEEAGLTPVLDGAAPYFEEARLVLQCRKLYTQDIDPKGFLDPALSGFYQNDYHRLYVGAIEKVLRRED